MKEQIISTEGLVRTRSPEAASAAYLFSKIHCKSCRSYHSVWPYLRLIHPPRGIDADRDLLIEILRQLLDVDMRVLLAGSADAGLAECVLDACNGRSIALEVMDICKTPLLQCAAMLNDRALGGLKTQLGSITGAPNTQPAHLIIAHSVLSFLQQDGLTAAGVFFRKSLNPGGRLILTTGLQSGSRVELEPVLFRNFVLAQLREQSIELPAPEHEFAELIEEFAKGRVSRASPFQTPEHVAKWLSDSGLVMEVVHDLARGTGITSDGRPLARINKGLLIVAHRPHHE